MRCEAVLLHKHFLRRKVPGPLPDDAVRDQGLRQARRLGNEWNEVWLAPLEQRIRNDLVADLMSCVCHCSRNWNGLAEKSMQHFHNDSEPLQTVLENSSRLWWWGHSKGFLFPPPVLPSTIPALFRRKFCNFVVTCIVAQPHIRHLPTA